ncbi:MAG: dihydrolipoyl dehydrogenase [Dehalococcoidia bacterium]|nr:dihydrolipoyl dehydrogenase [Dehalococcoidia bacterium]MSQ16766.1 dihydrolipoyl dehydrogenase [Dehalococcoidia bacterium]
MTPDYDVVVIGAGPGGYVAAIRAGQLGLKTAIVERDALGGVCLNWGCIPSKSLLKNAEVLSYFQRAEEFGIRLQGFTADYAVAMDRSRKVVDRNVKGVAYLLRKNKVEHIQGAAQLRRGGVVAVEPDGRQLKAKNIIIATGARPRSVPPLPVDGQKVLTSRESIVLGQLPGSIAIVGGGAIGVEFAQIYSSYGVAVTVVELLPRLVPNEDEEISQVLERSFLKRGIKVMTGTSVVGIDGAGSGVTLKLQKDGVAQSLACDKVLVAIGVQPNTENLGLEALGIATQRGYIQVDDNMSTNVPGVFAVGDVTGKLALAHVASAQGVAAVEHIAGQETRPLDYPGMPRCTYCHPQIASLGLTEAQAKEQGYDVKVGRFNVQANGKALAMGETEGVIKLVVDGKHGGILGAHMIGPEVTELLGELSMTRMLEGTTLELGWAVHAHPTLSEMLKEAALSAQGRALHM